MGTSSSNTGGAAKKRVAAGEVGVATELPPRSHDANVSDPMVCEPPVSNPTAEEEVRTFVKEAIEGFNVCDVCCLGFSVTFSVNILWWPYSRGKWKAERHFRIHIHVFPPIHMQNSMFNDLRSSVLQPPDRAPDMIFL